MVQSVMDKQRSRNQSCSVFLFTGPALFCIIMQDLRVNTHMLPSLWCPSPSNDYPDDIIRGYIIELLSAAEAPRDV